MVAEKQPKGSDDCRGLRKEVSDEMVKARGAEMRALELPRQHQNQRDGHERVIGGEKRSEPSADSTDAYNFRLALTSWEQIGSLASEVSTSVLAQLAASASEQLLAEDRSAKRRRTAATYSHPLPTRFLSDPTMVSSDDESDGIQHFPTMSRSFSQKVDRMARVSKHMMQIEHYHRLLQVEFAAIAHNDQDF